MGYLIYRLVEDGKNDGYNTGEYQSSRVGNQNGKKLLSAIKPLNGDKLHAVARFLTRKYFDNNWVLSVTYFSYLLNK